MGTASSRRERATACVWDAHIQYRNAQMDCLPRRNVKYFLSYYKTCPYYIIGGVLLHWCVCLPRKRDAVITIWTKRVNWSPIPRSLTTHYYIAALWSRDDDERRLRTPTSGWKIIYLMHKRIGINEKTSPSAQAACRQLVKFLIFLVISLGCECTPSRIVWGEGARVICGNLHETSHTRAAACCLPCCLVARECVPAFGRANKKYDLFFKYRKLSSSFVDWVIKLLWQLHALKWFNLKPVKIEI